MPPHALPEQTEDGLYFKIYTKEKWKKKIQFKNQLKFQTFFFFSETSTSIFHKKNNWKLPSTESTSQVLRLPMQPRMAGRQEMGFSTFSWKSDIQHQHTQQHFKEKLKIPDGVTRKLI